MTHELVKHHAAKELSLVESSYYLTAVEHKLVNFLASSIDGYSDSASPECSIRVADYAEVAGVSQPRAKLALAEALESLWRREIVWADGSMKCRWLQEKGSMEEGTLTATFSDRVFKALSQLKGSRYVKIVNTHSMVLKSGYVIRMLELLLIEKHLGNWVKAQNRYVCKFSFEELRAALLVPVSYRDYKTFRVQVLDRTVRELEGNNLAKVDYSVSKIGKKVDAITFAIFWVKDEDV